MPSSFPGAIDNFTDPLAASPLNSPSHATLHQDVNDAVEKIETYMGLVLVKTQALNAVTNNITSCFSSLYDSYRVVINNFSSGSSTIRSIFCRLLDGTTPNTTAQYEYVYNYAYSPNLGGNTGQSGQTAWEVGLASSRNGQSMVIEFHSPFQAVQTSILFQSLNYQGNLPGYIIRQGGGGHGLATSYNGFQIYGATDALSGTVRVYGYRN